MSIKTLLAFVLLALPLATGASAQTSSQSPGGEIPDPGFEASGSGIFTRGASRGTLSRDASSAHSGSHSLRHVSEEKNSYTLPWFGSNPISLGETAETLRFSTWVKAAAPDTWVRLYVFCLDADYRTSKEYWSGNLFRVGETWRKLSHTHTCPAESRYASVRLDNRDAGRTVWWDDLHLVRVENHLPDPGFESGELQPPFASARSGSVAIDGNRARKGFYSLRHTSDGEDSFTVPYQLDSAAILTPATEPRTYSFTAWASADADVPVQLSIFCLDEGLDSSTWGGSQASFTAREQWRKLEHSHTCPVGTRYVSVRLDNDGEAGSTVWWDDLVLEDVPEVEVLSVGPGYRLIDPAPGTRSTESTQLWEVNRAGVAGLPVSQAQKDWLYAAFDEDPSGTPSEVIYVSQELLDAVVRPDFPRGYERYMQPERAEDVARFSICSWREETRDRSWDIEESLYDRTFPFAGVIDGELTLNLPLTGDVDLSVTYKVRKCFGIPLGFKFASATAEGNVTLAGDGDLEATASARQHWDREWELANPRLGTITVWIGPVPVQLTFNLPIHAGLSLDAAIAARLTAGVDASAFGTFSYTCTPQGCTGQSDFTDDFEFTGPQASVQIDLRARAHVRVALRVGLFNPRFAFVEGGARPYAEASIWGYDGNDCGDADGDGKNERVEALAADALWGYDFVYGIGGWLLPDRDGEIRGRQYHLGWKDLLGSGGSTALKPMLLGPDSVAVDDLASFTVRMRPCYPYTHAVDFTMDPGSWDGDAVVAPPSGSATVSRRFRNPGRYPVIVTATSDAFGRQLSLPFRRILTVTQSAPAAPSSLAATALSTTAVRLAWRDNSQDETASEIQRALSPTGTFVRVGAAPANARAWVDEGLEVGARYRYRVRALKDDVFSAFSNVANVTTLTGPAAPSDLAAVYSPEARVRLSWTDNSSDEQGFQVQFSYSGSAWGDLSPATVGANTTTYTTGPNPPTGSYQFRVRAFGAGTPSAWSNVASLIVGAAPPPPTASIAWIKTAESTWGGPGTLTAAGHAANGTGRVQLVFRERSGSGTWGPWNTVGFQALPSENSTWSNTISSGNPTDVCHWFDAYVNYSGVTSPMFHYTGAPGCQ